MLWLLGAGAVLCLLAFSATARDTYLYFVSLLFVGAMGGFLHSVVFPAESWGRAPEPGAVTPRQGWQVHARRFHKLAALSCGLVAGIWGILLWTGERGLRSGGWFLFYVVIFAVLLVTTRPALKVANFRAVAATAVAMDVVLAAYEHLVLRHGTGWAYTGTIIGEVLSVPIENLLFIYPMAGALVGVMVAGARATRSDLRALWFVMGVLACIFVPIEFIGIGGFGLWDVDRFRHLSVWPFWHTNIEEFIYYLFFQLLAGLIYLWLDRNLAPPREAAGRSGG